METWNKDSEKDRQSISHYLQQNRSDRQVVAQNRSESSIDNVVREFNLLRSEWKIKNKEFSGQIARSETLSQQSAQHAIQAGQAAQRALVNSQTASTRVAV